MAESKPGQLEVKFVAVNHSEAELGDLGVNIRLKTTAAKPDDPPVAQFQANIPALSPLEIHDVSAKVATKMRIYELPDWQFLRAEFDITSPAPMEMTERLYYQDCYLREFTARVIEIADEGRRVYLDRTAFYPTSGGQPFDLGTLGGVAVREVIDEEDRIAHVLEAPLAAAEVQGIVDWDRRYDHMQQHTGQHLLSAVLEELFKIRTVSFHLGSEVSTIDVDAPALTAEQLERAEDRCAEIVAEARPVQITFEDASARSRASQSLHAYRHLADRHHRRSIDRSACGGTHVRTAAEIGMVLTGKTGKDSRNHAGRIRLRNARAAPRPS